MVSRRFQGKKNFDGPSAATCTLIRSMYSLIDGEGSRNVHLAMVAGRGRCGNLAMIFSSDSPPGFGAVQV